MPAGSSAAGPSGGSPSLFRSENFRVNPETGISPFQTMAAYMGGSLIQTVGDNPVTAYRQLVQQYAKDPLTGKPVDPKVARAQANGVFRASPVAASLSGVTPRLVGVGAKRLPKFGFLLLISFGLSPEGNVGMAAATGASVLSAPFINPIRMIEKQQRATLRETGREKPILEILRESRAQRFEPLFRGTVPLMGHSFASATLGLVGQPQLHAWIKEKAGSETRLSSSAANLAASAAVSPLYVLLTNPLSRLEVIMQTQSIKGERVGLGAASKELARDAGAFGLRGAFRGQGVGIAKAVVSLSLFHEARIGLTDAFKRWNGHADKTGKTV